MQKKSNVNYFETEGVGDINSLYRCIPKSRNELSEQPGSEPAAARCVLASSFVDVEFIDNRVTGIASSSRSN